jgi:hypothetical protein
LLGDAGTQQQMDSSMQADTGGNDAAAPQDATADVPIIKDAMPDISIGPPDSFIQCGPTLTCSAKTAVCCDHTLSSTEWQCVASVSACNNAGDVPISCSSHDNCVSQGTPGDICCANLVDNGTCGVPTTVSCMATCNPNMDQTQIGCGTGDPCPTDEPTCKASTCTLPDYNICSP